MSFQDWVALYTLQERHLRLWSSVGRAVAGLAAVDRTRMVSAGRIGDRGRPELSPPDRYFRQLPGKTRRLHVEYGRAVYWGYAQQRGARGEFSGNHHHDCRQRRRGVLRRYRGSGFTPKIETTQGATRFN